MRANFDRDKSTVVIMIMADDCDALEIDFPDKQVNSCAKCHLLWAISARVSVLGTTTSQKVVWQKVPINSTFNVT